LPLGPQPRSGAMLVLIHVSSMKTSRFGSKYGATIWMGTRIAAAENVPECSMVASS
jgi:hypothetical protein